MSCLTTVFQHQGDSLPTATTVFQHDDGRESDNALDLDGAFVRLMGAVVHTVGAVVHTVGAVVHVVGAVVRLPSVRWALGSFIR